MAFVPLVNFCLEKNTDGDYELVINDITDVYDDPDNLTGWEDVDTILAADVTAMEIIVSITDSTNTTSTYEADVISSLSDPVTGTFELATVTSQDINLVDGFYKIQYTVTVGSTTYTTCKQKIVYPTVGCCISTAVKKLINNLTDEDQQKHVDKMKAFEYALIEAGKCLDITNAMKILALLQDYCNSSKSNDCGCGCS